MKMARLFRSKSCTLVRVTAANSVALDSTSSPSPSLFQEARNGDEEEEEEEDEEEEEEEDADEESFGDNSSPVTTPFIGPEERRHGGHNNKSTNNNQHQFPILAVLATALRKSLVTCSVERDDVANMDIGWPTEVRQLSHVTFDPFNGFLGLPVELQPDVPRKVPSASVSVFGVSAQSMQCSYDHRGNSVPTILLMMQNQLYSEGGLRAEGIFRINAENSQEEHVRNQLNKGVVPSRIDVHCLAGLIKAWFRELPTGVLDSLTPEQVMHCNTEEECTQIVKLLPKTEAALLDWAINLMGDVVQHEQFNKMNARNIAMVFAPNMTQMADPLTALIHAVQVMNFLKTLVIKTLREREESAAVVRLLSSTGQSANGVERCSSDWGVVLPCQQDVHGHCKGSGNNLLRSATLDRQESETEEKFWSKDDGRKESECMGRYSARGRRRQSLGSRFKDGYESEEVEEGILENLSLRKGMRKLCRHPVFQLSKPVKKNERVSIVNTREDGGSWRRRGGQEVMGDAV